MNQTMIIEFLLEAKKNTYSIGGGKTKSSRPNSYDYEFSKDNYKYIDSYLGTHLFSGQEAVWYNNKPIWSMNYCGRVLDQEKFSGSFLKKALMNPSYDNPFRGQPIFTEGEYTYKMEYTGSFEWYVGSEKIYFKDELVYELNFHGGYILDKTID